MANQQSEAATGVGPDRGAVAIGWSTRATMDCGWKTFFFWVGDQRVGEIYKVGRTWQAIIGRLQAKSRTSIHPAVFYDKQEAMNYVESEWLCSFLP